MNLSIKTVFLLSLATAGRRGELHALPVEPHCLKFSDSDGSVQLLCQVGFLAKNSRPSMPPTPFVVPSLSHNCVAQDPDRLLCPVRALKFYLTATESIRGARNRLFIPVKGSSDISPTTISRWIVSAVKSAYSNISHADMSLCVLTHMKLELCLLRAHFYITPLILTSFNLLIGEVTLPSLSSTLEISRSTWTISILYVQL